MSFQNADASELELVALNHASAELAPLIEAAAQYARSAKAPSTRRAYASDWQAFEAWCYERNIKALPCPGEVIALYAAALARAGRRVSTIGRHLVSICARHHLAGHTSPRFNPVLSETLKGIRRTLGVASVKKAPAIIERLRAMLATLPNTLRGARDRALLNVGFTGTFRRSELVGIDVPDIEWPADGLLILLRKSKTDQEGEGEKVALPFGSHLSTCPVRSLRAYLELAKIDSGPVFRAVDHNDNIGTRRLCDRSVARIVQRVARAAGLDADFGGHSLRAGFITTAARAGKSESSIMRQSRQKSVSTMRGYVRDLGLFEDNAATGIGL